MEKKLVLKHGVELNGKPIDRARQLEHKKIRNLFVFTLDDGFTFFILLDSQIYKKNKMRDKMIIQPRYATVNRILSLVDSESLQERISIHTSFDVPIMHLVNALFVVFREIKIDIFCSFKCLVFSIIEDEHDSRIVLDCGIKSDKEVLVIKMSEKEVFLIESKGEIRVSDLVNIISCIE